MRNGIHLLMIILPLYFLSMIGYSHAQCACVWKNPTGNIQCQLYTNCSSTYELACSSKSNGGNMYCVVGANCPLYPGSTSGCAPLCFGNGACWYQGTTCRAIDVCPAILLPIGMINLKAEKKADFNLISWQTSHESNNEYFIVYRSDDAVNWKEQVRLEGAGTTASLLSYSVEDYEPIEGINYYQIVQVDISGDMGVYGTMSVDNSRAPRILIKSVNMLGQEVG